MSLSSLFDISANLFFPLVFNVLGGGYLVIQAPFVYD